MQLKNQWCGIVFFGPPGSGKSTIATKLTEHIERARLVEMSRDIIKPLSQVEVWPETIQELIKTLDNAVPGFFNSFTREKGQAVFEQLRNMYGPSALADLVWEHSINTWLGSVTIVSGMRGFDNASTCKQNGFLVIYVDAPKRILETRLQEDRGMQTDEAKNDIESEEVRYQTTRTANVADLQFDTSQQTPEEIVNSILENVCAQECGRCINTTNNPTISLDSEGLCQICRNFVENYSVDVLKNDFAYLLKHRSRSNYDCLVGISGGKDSTATLATVLDLGLRPLAFTIDSGYYPSHIISRAKSVASQLGVDHTVISLRPYIRLCDYRSYEKTLEFFEQPLTPGSKQRFIDQYTYSRRHYSAKCTHSLAYVRACQLCRHSVIRAYYAEAKKQAIPFVILGINEWTHLSSNVIGSMRRIQPSPCSTPVHIVHLPFMLQRRVDETRQIIERMNWQPPTDEELIESGSNSCLFTRATERLATHMLGFHPDSTRLAREVTVGFLTKKQARAAACKFSEHTPSLRSILKHADLLREKNSNQNSHHSTK